MSLPRIGPVTLAGENSVIWLHDERARMVAAASYWRADWSPAGSGSTLFLWADDGDPSDRAGVRLILTDNPGLARFIDLRFNRFFPGCAERGFGTITPEIARFSRADDGERWNRLTAVGAATAVELEWRGAAPGQLSFFDNTSDPGRAYDVTSVICHCDDARILVGGQPVAGRVIGNEELIDAGGDGHEPGYRSAFLAFCETWVERDGPSRFEGMGRVDAVAPPAGLP